MKNTIELLYKSLSFFNFNFNNSSNILYIFYKIIVWFLVLFGLVSFGFMAYQQL